jgi:long-chain acyl-CoA synthetase
VSVLLTGGTGFVGMEVLARLVERGDDVVVLVRGNADERLAATFDTLGTPPAQRRRARAVAGDLDRLPRIDGVDRIVHCAASISFDLPLAEARAVNVEGTRAVLDLAASLPRLERLVHVSTAYVAGRHRGLFRERQLRTGQRFRNTYEQTKLEAEELIHSAGLPAVLARPSIVMGESGSGWTPAFNVLYWPLQAFARGLLEALPARPDAQVDIVPVDYVADAIVALLDGDRGGAFHLVAGRDAPTVEDLIALSTQVTGRPRPRLVPVGAKPPFAGAEQYLPYFDMGVVFDNTRALQAVGPAPAVATYFPRLVAYAQRARWGKRALTRTAA